MRYQIVNMDGVVVDVTNSYAEAIAWAHSREEGVYDDKLHKLIYDGYRDEPAE